MTDEEVRVERIEALYRRHVRNRGGHSLRFWRKKYAWRFAVGTASLVKRMTDIVVAIIALLLLAPVFAIIALLHKATDRGPVFFWQMRVGQWGREFPFPKFRSMVTNAEALKDKLLAMNDHKDGSVTFKMKNDPRITWIGRILRNLAWMSYPNCGAY